MPTPPRAIPVTVFLAVLLPSLALACMWDYDTIKMERSRFPEALELITGKFLRHSAEFYEWRIEDRLKRLETEPDNVALWDDLAVAYDKTGRHEQAIETALHTETLQPGRYETAANLATFYFHAGRLDEGLPHIERALAINPDAHFGREKYQKLLVEYVIQQRDGGPLEFPLADVKSWTAMVRESPSAREVSVSDTFADFLISQSGEEKLTPDAASAAVKGILGMMRFGNHKSPVLLEALGAVLTQGAEHPEEDAKLLAARALLKASYEVADEEAQAAYRGWAALALQMQTPRRDEMGQASLEAIEADFQRELDEAEGWYADLKERELSWIRDGRNPEAEFDKLYAADPQVTGMDETDPKLSASEKFEIYGRIAVVVAVILLTAFLAACGCVVYWLWKWASDKAVAEPRPVSDGE